MTSAADLRTRAEDISARLPSLLADAEHLAATVLMGVHGRRRSGIGDEFWQYRPAVSEDSARSIDWRRSARSDQHYVQEKEWQAAQSVTFWVDNAQSMNFASSLKTSKKNDRAQVISLALSILLIRAGERVFLADVENANGQGEPQILQMAQHFASFDSAEDFGSPTGFNFPPRSRAVFVSDFMGRIDGVVDQLGGAADRGVKGVLLQILDPQEEAFPFDGRTIFESVGGSVSHETMKASDLRGRYLERLANRKAELHDLAKTSGWQYFCHHTGEPAQAALLWAYSALARRN